MVDSGLSKIEEDFEHLKETLVQYLKQVITGHKTQIIKRFSDLNNSNSRSLGSISQKINQMMGFSEDIHKELHKTLIANIDDTSKLERIITGTRSSSDLLTSRKDFLDSLQDIKIMSSNFSTTDIISNYNMEKKELTKLGARIKDRLSAAISTILGNDEFRQEIVSKPMKTIKDVKIRTSPVFDVPKLDKLKTAGLKSLGAFELSKHASHHILSSCMINGVFMATGHADSTFKLWTLNPQYFDTSFTTNGQKKVSSEEIQISGTTSGTSANFKRKEVTELKPDSQVLPLELAFTSTQDYHKHYVTALAFVYRRRQNDMLLISGDSAGELIVSELSYNQNNRKVDQLTQLFKRKAHRGQIVKLENTQFDDVVVSAGQDGAVM